MATKICTPVGLPEMCWRNKINSHLGFLHVFSFILCLKWVTCVGRCSDADAQASFWPAAVLLAAPPPPPHPFPSFFYCLQSDQLLELISSVLRYAVALPEQAWRCLLESIYKNQLDKKRTEILPWKQKIMKKCFLLFSSFSQTDC